MLPGFIERLLDARTIPDIGAVFHQAMAHLGFEHALYAGRFMLSVPRSVMQENPVVLSNLPPRLIDQAQQLRDLHRDPWIEWVLNNDGDIAARDLLARGVHSPSLALAADHGVGAVQIVSLRDKVLNGVGAVLAVPFQGAGDHHLRERWALAGRDVRVLSWVMHMRIATMHRHPAKATLTPRQREVLGWRSSGKTVAETAMILGITPATVEKHMRLAREALGVDTTPQAVLKAHVTHQLFGPATGSTLPRGEDGEGKGFHRFTALKNRI